MPGIIFVLIFFRQHRLFSRSWWKYVVFFSLVGASHGLLDALTDDGLGIALLAPFDNTRYFFPWTPIPVSSIGLRAFLSDWGLRVIIFEIVYIWVPVIVVLLGVLFVKRNLFVRAKVFGLI